MRHRMIAAALFGNFSLAFGLASATPATTVDPVTLCQGVACTEAMREIVAEFGDRVDWVLTPPVAASGDCLHLHPQYRPEDTHHALALFEAEAGGASYRGLFSFYAGRNPYAEFDLSAARSYLSRISGDKPGRPLGAGDRWRQAHFPSAGGDIVYWFARSRKDGSILLLGRWFFPEAGSDTRMFCRLRSQASASKR